MSDPTRKAGRRTIYDGIKIDSGDENTLTYTSLIDLRGVEWMKTEPYTPRKTWPIAATVGMVYGIGLGLLELVLKIRIYLFTVFQLIAKGPSDPIVQHGSMLILRHTFWIALVYCVLGACLGTLIGQVHDILRRARRSGPIRSPGAFYMALFLLPPLFSILYGNIHLSLAGTGGIFRSAGAKCIFAAFGAGIAGPLLAWLLYAAISRIGRRPAIAALGTRRHLLISLSLVMALIAGISYLPPAILGDGPASFRSESPRTAPAAPNVILIVLDTLRADHLSCYGYPHPTTPNLDRFAREATLYEQAYAQSPWTLPSHASIFTGTYPSQHDTQGEHLHLDDEHRTIAEALDEAGYRTACFANNPWLSRFANTVQGFEHVEPVWVSVFNLHRPILLQALATSISKPVRDDGAEKTNELVFSWLDKAREDGSPFFLFINYMEVHDPNPYRPGYVEPFIPPGLSKQELRNFRVENQLHYYPGQKEFTPRVFEMLGTLYDGELRYLDDKLGELFDGLRARDVYEEALIIITSDHGENLGEHDLWGHQFSLNNTILHVPLLVRLPSRFPPGGRTSAPVRLIDIAPTILDVLALDDAPLSSQLRGMSLLAPDLEGGPPRDAVAEYARPINVVRAIEQCFPDQDLSGWLRRMRSLQAGALKYIWSSDEQESLFHIAEDPAELRDLSAEKPGSLDELSDRLASKELAFRDRGEGEAGFVVEPDERTREQLKALGYIE